MPHSNYSGFSDEELVKAILKNDQNAFKNFYYKYYNALIRFAWFRVHSMETSQDLVQETFFRVWIKRASLNPQKSIKAYLYKTLTNLIINHLKLSSSMTTSLESIRHEDRINDEHVIELKLDLENALNKLPEKLKTVYLLSRLDGYKYAEIAEICNISIKAVEKRISKAFTLLRKIFTNKNY